MKFDIWVYCKKLSENSSFTTIGKEKRVFYMKTNTNFWSYLAQFFLEWEIFQTRVVEKIKTHILCSLTFFEKMCCLWINVGKCRASRGDRWQYGAQAFHTGYPRIQTHTFGICNTYCFSNATMVVQSPSTLCYTYTAHLV